MVRLPNSLVADLRATARWEIMKQTPNGPVALWMPVGDDVPLRAILRDVLTRTVHLRIANNKRVLDKWRFSKTARTEPESKERGEVDQALKAKEN